MNQYQTRRGVVEAFQITSALRPPEASWPKWLEDAWKKNKYEPGALRPSNPDRPDGGLDIVVDVGVDEGTVPVLWGDWIVRGADGALYRCPADLFGALYEPTEAE